MAIPKDRTSDEIDLDFDDQLDAVLEQRLSGHPARSASTVHRSSDEASNENITVRPPTGESGVRAAERETTLDLTHLETSHVEPEPRSEPIPAGLGLSWDYLRRQVPLSLGIRLRALVEVLAAVGALHTDSVRAANKRFHGALWYGNLLFRNDGSAILLKDESVTPQPAVYTAPELRRQQGVSQQADFYAIGVMLLEALADQSLSSPEVNDLTQSDLASHPFWGPLAGDPLLWVAVRATAREPSRRWPSAREFADALSECALERIASREALGQLICAALAEQCDRATPLVSAPVSSRGVPAMNSGAFRLSMPLSPLEARAASEISNVQPTRPEPPPPPSRRLSQEHTVIARRDVLAAPVQAASAAPATKLETAVITIEDAPRTEDVAQSVVAERIALFDTELVADEGPRKRRRAPIVVACAVVLLSAGAFLAARQPWNTAAPALSAERAPTSPPTRANAVDHTDPGAATPAAVNPVEGSSPTGETPLLGEDQARAPTTHSGGANIRRDPAAVDPLPDTPGNVTGKRSAPAPDTKTAPLSEKAERAKAPSQPSPAPERVTPKPRAASRYEPDGI